MADVPPQRHLAAILVADVVGYSRLIGADEEGTLARLVTLRDRLIRPAIAESKGRMFKTTGDGFLAEFASVVDCVRCAAAIQAAAERENRTLSADQRIRLRIGIHLGDVVLDGDDVYGDGVIVAARLEKMAEPGCVCISEDAYRQVRGKLDIAWTDLGDRRLKNISAPVRAYTTRDPARHAAGGLAARLLGGRPRWRTAAGVGAVVALALVAGAGLGGGRWLDGVLVLLRAAPPASPIPVVAVLPFAGQSAAEEHRYFADGFTDELIGALGRFNSLRVISRNAVLQYTERPVTLADIASGLGASYFVEGRVRRAGRSVRIAAQLTDVRTGTLRWTDRYDGDFSDLFEFQDSIARRIAGTVAANITQMEAKRRLQRRRPGDDVHDLILKVRAIGFGASRSVNRRARRLIDRAVKLDPTYATAHALLAEAVYARVILGWTEFADRELSRAEASARRAIALAPDEPDGYRALGRILVVRGEYDHARAALKRAIEINPSDANALAVWGSVQGFVGNIDEATDALEEALRYDPTLEPNYVLDLAVDYYLARRHRDALRTAEFGIARYPAFPMFNVVAAAAAARLGEPELTGRYVEEVRRRLPFFDPDRFGSRFENVSHRAYLRGGLSAAGL